MKKQMIVIAMMSMIVTLAGCASETDMSGITKNSPADSATVTEAPAAKEADMVSSESEKAAESKSDKKEEKKDEKVKKDEKNEKTESKSDEKVETPVTPENKPEEKTENPTGKRVAASDVTEIVGEWVEMGNGEARFITVNSDGSFEVFTNYDTITSGNVTVDTVDGVKQYSFNDTRNGLWYVPFVYTCVDGYEMLATTENPVYGTVSFCRKNEDLNPSPVYQDIVGTWYEEDANGGRTITINNDGIYTVDFGNGSTSTGSIAAQSTDDNQVLYIFYSNYPDIWYSFTFINNSFPELISYQNEDHDTVAFSREPSSVSVSEAIDKITGTWYPDDPNYPTLVVNADSTYDMVEEDGSIRENSDNYIKVEIRGGVEKYSFKDDRLGTWLVPFEVRNGGSTLITEDNPVYGIISYHR